MKKIIGTILITATLAACGNNGQSDVNAVLSGDANLNIRDNLTECLVRQNGTTLFVMQNGLDTYRFAFDPSVTYDDAWVNLTLADSLRVTPLTPTEQNIIAGVQ